MSLLVLGLGLAGLLCQISSAALPAAGLGLGGLWAYRARDAWTARPATYRADPMSGSPAWNWLWLAAAPLLAAALVAAFVPPGLLWKPEEPHGYDAVEYHLQVPREWHDAGRIGPTPHNAFGYFPFAVEMHYLLAMHLRGGAWAGMYLAQLMHVAMVALSAVAAWGVASQLARDRRFAVVASVAGATVPWLAQLAPLAFNEGGLLLYGTLTIGWTLIVVRGVGSTPSSLRFLLPGLLAGFACGVKLTAVPLLLLAVPAVALLALLRRSPRLAVLGPLVFGLAGTAAFSPWLIRNVAWTGNPVFPEGTALFGKAHFSDEQVDRWKRAHRPQPAQAGPGARVAALGDQVVRSWQFGYVLLPLAGLALVTSVAVRRGSGGVEDGDGGDDDGGSGDGGPTPSVAGGPVPWMLAGLLLIQLAFWLGFTHLQGRFFLLAVPVAVMCVAVAPWDRLVSGRAGGAVAAALAAVVIVGAAVGWSNVHRRLAHKLYEEQGTGMAVALGRPEIDGITGGSLAGSRGDDPSARLLLVGEAQAFWYPLSGDRLVYRTVFDLDTSGGRSLADALDPQGLRRDGRTWRLIAPAELER